MGEVAKLAHQANAVAELPGMVKMSHNLNSVQNLRLSHSL